MKVVLVNPPYNMWSAVRLRRIAAMLGHMAPLGLLALAAHARRHVPGIEPEVLDAPALFLSEVETAAEIIRRQPQVVGFTATTAAMPSVQRISARVKAALPQALQVAGGPHISGAGGDSLRELPAVDCAVTGEGEETFSAILEAIRAERGFSELRGVIWRTETGEIRRNPPREFLTDLDTLPFPAWDLLPGFPHLYAASAFFSPPGPAASLTTSRGCPFDCSFCDQSTFGRRPRAASAEYVFDAVRHLQSRYGVRYIIFCDDTFTLNRERVMEICRRMRRLRGLSWSCDANVMTVDRDMLRAMKRAGCWSISFGLESGSPQVLESLNKRIDLSRARRVVEETRAADIHVKGLFILGTPEESRESIRQTQRFIASLPLSTMNLSKFAPYPGSRLHALVAGGLAADHAQTNGMNFVVPSRHLSIPKLEKAYAQTLRMFYNSRRAWRVHLPILLRHWRILAEMVVRKPKSIREPVARWNLGT